MKHPPHSRKVLFVVSDDFYFITHRLRFAKYLKESGYEVAVACRNGGRFHEIEKEGLEAFDLQIERKNLGVFAILKEILQIKKVVSRFQPDVVHVVALRMIFLFGCFRFFARPDCATINAVAGMGMLFAGQPLGFKHRTAKWVLEKGLRILLRGEKVHAIFQNSDDLALARELGWVPLDGGVLIRGVGVAVPDSIIPPKTDMVPVVLFAGRLLREKGVMNLIEASTCLYEQGVKHQLRIVGGFDTNPNSLSKVQLDNQKGKNWITFAGHINDVTQEILSSHMVVLPTFYREGIPKILLEAGALARPVITCDVVGCRELVVDGRTGRLVPPQNVDALAVAMRELIENPELSREMGIANRDRIEAEFSEPVIFEQLLEHYQVTLS